MASLIHTSRRIIDLAYAHIIRVGEISEMLSLCQLIFLCLLRPILNADVAPVLLLPERALLVHGWRVRLVLLLVLKAWPLSSIVEVADF